MEMEEIPEFLRRKKGEKREPFVEVKAEAVIPEEPEQEETVEGPSTIEKIQRGMREAAGVVVNEINEAYDAFLLNGAEFNCYELLRSRDVKPAITKLVGERFVPVLTELLASYKDAELKKAYANINVKESVKFWEGVLSDCDRWFENQKGIAAKAPRKKYTTRTTPEARVKSVKYQKEDLALKLKSIPPERIIGAQELWTYNTKYKHLTHYLARNRDGLTVKGTTIFDFDVDNSVSKVLRKPEETLAKVFAKKKKILDTLTTKAIAPTGRINESTILLRVG